MAYDKNDYLEANDESYQKKLRLKFILPSLIFGVIIAIFIPLVYQVILMIILFVVLFAGYKSVPLGAAILLFWVYLPTLGGEVVGNLIFYFFIK